MSQVRIYAVGLQHVGHSSQIIGGAPGTASGFRAMTTDSKPTGCGYFGFHANPAKDCSAVLSISITLRWSLCLVENCEVVSFFLRGDSVALRRISADAVPSAWWL